MDLRAGAPLLCGQAETVRVIQPGEEKTGGMLLHFPVHKGVCEKAGEGLAGRACDGWMRVDGFKLNDS